VSLPNFSYLTLVSKIDRTTAKQNLFTSLGCYSTPIVLSSHQQDFVLTGVQQNQSQYSYPMFSFSRGDQSHTCGLGDQNATFGPYAPTGTSYTFFSNIKSSTSTTLQAENLYKVVGPVFSAFNITTSPTIGGVSAVAASTALTQFEAYLNQNMQLTLVNNATLLDFNLIDVKNGSLIYTAPLTIHGISPITGDTTVPVGTLQVFVKTKLSLFTDETVSGFSLPDLGTNVLPNYRYIHPWTASVTPVGQTNSQQLSVGIDSNEPDAANHVLPKLNALTASSTPDQISQVCKSLRSRLEVLHFDQEDILAITADALLSAPGAREGANYARGKNSCFDADERVLMHYMNIPSGNDDSVLTGSV
jgi:hypothetical protein